MSTLTAGSRAGSKPGVSRPCSPGPRAFGGGGEGVSHPQLVCRVFAARAASLHKHLSSDPEKGRYEAPKEAACPQRRAGARHSLCHSRMGKRLCPGSHAPLPPLQLVRAAGDAISVSSSCTGRADDGTCEVLGPAGPLSSAAALLSLRRDAQLTFTSSSPSERPRKLALASPS